MTQTAIERLEFLTSSIPQQLKAIDDRIFNHKASPEKWSKKEILGHLIDSATNNHQRFVRGQFEDSPVIGYNQDKWVEHVRYTDLDKGQLITFWTTYNQFLASVIKLIPTDQLNQTCTMRNGTQLTLEFLIIDYVDHLEYHLKQIIG